jgi:hypothetical protein
MKLKFKIYNILLLFFLTGSSVFGQDLSYYLPKGVTYNEKVPKPQDVLGFHVGEFHASHDNLVYWLRPV